MTRRARIYVHGQPAAVLEETSPRTSYRFTYDADYAGPSASLTLPIEQGTYDFDRFPPFFDGLLPEGLQLDALLRRRKIDADDYLSQLIAVGGDLVGAITIEEESR